MVPNPLVIPFPYSPLVVMSRCLAYYLTTTTMIGVGPNKKMLDFFSQGGKVTLPREGVSYQFCPTVQNQAWDLPDLVVEVDSPQHRTLLADHLNALYTRNTGGIIVIAPIC